MIERNVIRTDRAPGAVGPYSQAVRAGELIFTAGQIPLSPASGEMAGGTVREQTAQALDNLRGLLEAAGSGLDRIVKTTVFLTDMGAFAEMNDVYAGYFGEGAPARSCVEVAALPKGALVEIEAIALAGENA
jgi:2-iminobutanoate/2-iminopropanoate deaminase